MEDEASYVGQGREGESREGDSSVDEDRFLDSEQAREALVVLFDRTTSFDHIPVDCHGRYGGNVDAELLDVTAS